MLEVITERSKTVNWQLRQERTFDGFEGQLRSPQHQQARRRNGKRLLKNLYFVQHPIFYPLKYLTLSDTGWYTWHPCVIRMAPYQSIAFHDEARIASNIHYVIVRI